MAELSTRLQFPNKINSAILIAFIDPVSVAVGIGPIQAAMVGGPLTIQCIANTTEMLDVSLVIFNWTRPGGDTITNDSRVTISPTISSGNIYTSTIQFTYLMEGDNGTYTCNVMILETNESSSVVLETLNGE